MKRVLFVISCLATGGAERAVSNITCHFAEGWDIDILVNDEKAIDYPFRGNILTLGITGEQKTSSIFFQFKSFIKRIKKLKELKKAGNYCACISFKDSANIANILSGKRHCRVIVSIRNSLINAARFPQYKYVVNPLAKLLYNSADKVVAVSKGVEMEMIRSFHIRDDKVTVIENGYNIIDICRQGQEKLTDEENKLIDGKVVITTMGRLTTQKGQWHLVRAFSEVVKHIPNAVLIIIGSGKLEKYLKQLSQAYNIENQIYFTGHVLNPYKYLTHSDIFVFPSLYEGFPNALAEAVCLGIPCIATDFSAGAREILAPDMVGVDGVVETVKEVEYGILTPLCSGKQYNEADLALEQAEQCLMEAMLRILLSKEKSDKYRQKSKLRSETLDIDSAVSKWIELIADDKK